MAGQPAAGGGRWIEVPAGRVERWLAGFHDRHEVRHTSTGPDVVRFDAADGEVAECHPPFPPLEAEAIGEVAGFAPGPLVSHVRAHRTVGVLLVRAARHAAGVFEGNRLVESKVGSRLVHSRHAAGGWSQQRFARRRQGQLRAAYGAAADDAAKVLLPHAGRLDAVVLGGDRRAVAAVGEDPRLAPLFRLATDRFLTVPDPRLAVLQGTPAAFGAVRIRLVAP